MSDDYLRIQKELYSLKSKFDDPAKKKWGYKADKWETFFKNQSAK